MIHTTFAGAGIALEGEALPKPERGVSASTPAREDYNTLVDPYVHFLPRQEHEKLVDLALKHSITPTAMRELVTAAMDAKEKGLAAAAQTAAAPAGGSNPSASNQVHPNFTAESFSGEFRHSERDTYKTFRQRHRAMWDSVLSSSEEDLAKQGTTRAAELKKLADQYATGFDQHKRFSGQFERDLSEMERVIQRNSLPPFIPPWTRLFQRLTAAFAG